MMSSKLCLLYFPILYLGFPVTPVTSMSLFDSALDEAGSSSNSEISDIILSKGYLPNEKELSNTVISESVDTGTPFLLSRLSDKELVELLEKQQIKKQYDITDIVDLAKSRDKSNSKVPFTKHNNFKSENKAEPQQAFFKLDKKVVDPYSFKPSLNPSITALQKLNNLLYSRPADSMDLDDDDKKELLFDTLVAQLKTLCCKRNTQNSKPKIRGLLDDLNVDSKKHHRVSQEKAKQQMFLILNDELKSDGNDDLISVDPESLDQNSSVLLLGPLKETLTDAQLKKVMNRITKELVKPEYLALLNQLSEGSLSSSNFGLMKNVISGPETRRYIKPHRCNHQSKLARIFGGPKWIICTGYINLNTPSLYD